MIQYLETSDSQARTYLDHNATTPLAQEVADLVPEWLRLWGNASSIHQHGRGPKALLRDARQSVAAMVGCSPLEVVFTSGGSEANNLAISGILAGISRLQVVRGETHARRRLICSAVEHPSVLKTMQAMETQGYHLDLIPVNRGGQIDLDAYQALLSSDVALVSVMLANNETGNVFPVKKMAAAAHQVGALFHCDAVQGLGKMPLQVGQLGVDTASFSGHKFYSLKGCGFLYSRKGTILESLIHGGGQERGRRAGTENVLAIASLGQMCRHLEDLAAKNKEMSLLRDWLEDELIGRIPGVRVTGGEAMRLPNTLALVIVGVDGESLLMNLDLKGFSVSTGAACSAGSPEPSPVLLAMGLSREEAQSSLRISLGWGTRRSDLESFVIALEETVQRLRQLRSPSSEVVAHG